MEKLTYTVAYTKADEFEDWLIDNDYEYKRNEDYGMYDVFTIIVLEDEAEEVDDLVDNFFNHE